MVSSVLPWTGLNDRLPSSFPPLGAFPDSKGVGHKDKDTAPEEDEATEAEPGRASHKRVNAVLTCTPQKRVSFNDVFPGGFFLPRDQWGLERECPPDSEQDPGEGQ